MVATGYEEKRKVKKDDVSWQRRMIAKKNLEREKE
jgi:hypothetical protein